jgi:hypothetical protein
MFKRKKPIHLPKLDFTNKKLGFTVVLIGIIVALVLGGLATLYSWETNWMWWLLAIGVVVGILNIFHEEGVLFLISGLTMAFMLSLLADLILFPTWAVTLFNAVIYLLASASVIVGFKVLYALATTRVSK